MVFLLCLASCFSFVFMLGVGVQFEFILGDVGEELVVLVGIRRMVKRGRRIGV
jgi:hypothetical protein